MLDFLLVILGLAGLIVGGGFVVRGASDLARLFGVSPLVVGLTVVAFGTSVPELAVNMAAALREQTDLCFGNIIGSNVANIGLILGFTALMAPVSVGRTILIREIPLLVLGSGAALALGADSLLGGDADRIGRGDAIVLLLFFCVFVYFTARDVFRGNGREAAAAGEAPTSSKGGAALRIVLGLVLLAVGGRITVDGASGVARSLGVTETVIGLTIVSVGTSLPELITSFIAAKRNESDLAVGNVVGSNIFNLFLVLGVSGSITPVPLPAGGRMDLLIMTGLTLILLPMGFSDRSRIVRWEGGALLGIYVLYIASKWL
jgi:cation:H+ antiporter